MVEEILVVCRDSVCFGIPTDQIGQILRVPEMTALAFSPKEVHGMCAVGGSITTAVDMNMLLGMEKVDPASSKSRILTFSGSLEATALVVPEVIASVMIDPAHIEYRHGSRDSIAAIYHQGERLIQVVDLDRMLSGLRPASVPVREVSEKSEGAGSVSEIAEQHGRYLVFRMGGEMFAMGIDNLREILGSHQSITTLSGTDEEVVGMMSLREELILVADLRLHYGIEPRRSDKNRILITQFGQKVLGLMIDEIVDIREFPLSQVERFAENEEKTKASGVIHDAQELISVVSSDAVRNIIQRYESLIIPVGSGTVETGAEIVLETVIFKLGYEEYAINIEKVAEIIDVTPITPVAVAPESVSGVVNIRGQIVTIGSLHRKLNIEPPHGAEQKIIICDTPRGRMGFFVDAVSDVMGVRSGEIHEENDPRSLFSHILHLEGGERLVMLLELERLYGWERGK